MKQAPYLQIRIILAIVLALGSAMSVLVYFNGRAAQSVSEPLLRQQLPALEIISDLQLAVAAQEPILYEYYASVDRNTFVSRFREIEREIEHDVAALSNGLIEPRRLRLVRDYCDQMSQLAAKLDGTLKVYGKEAVDWDRAREILGEVSLAGRRVNAELGQIAGDVRQAVSVGSEQTSRRVDSAIQVVLAFSVLFAAIAGFVGYTVSAYLAEDSARHKLAMFVENNPNPVLRLSPSGEVLYANPACDEMQQRFGLEPEPKSNLLSSDVVERQKSMLRSGRRSDRFEFDIGDMTIDCALTYLPEHHAFHCYLSDITKRTNAEQRLRVMALHDSLTDLPNRRFLEQVIAVLPVTYKYWLMLINLDRVHKFLGNVGPEAVDSILKVVAGKLGELFPVLAGHPQLYRFEGDSFVLLVPAMDETREIDRLAQRVLAVIADIEFFQAANLRLSASIGIGRFPDDGRHMPELLHSAGAALHSVKQAGGGHYRVYDAEMRARTQARMAMESDLRTAIQNDELSLVFQPQIQLRTENVSCAEALIRWKRGNHGMVSPVEFIPVAEESGLITPIGEWMLERACRAAVNWQRDIGRTAVAVNISARQFQSPDLVERIRDLLQSSGLEPSLLELEITESSAMEDVNRAVHILDELKSLGIRLAIDDFGTGFSSMSYLSRFPIDRLKIDQSFVRNLEQDRAALEITAATILLGHKLGLEVVAEGVETEAQLQKLRELDCDQVQGFLFSKPVSESEFMAYSRRYADAAVSGMNVVRSHAIQG